MTLHIPDSSIGDKILRRFGKKRALIFPKGSLEGRGFDAYAYAVKESFWRALIRSKASPLPEGTVEYESVREEFDAIKGR
jgi:hypothetical protein